MIFKYLFYFINILFKKFEIVDNKCGDNMIINNSHVKKIVKTNGKEKHAIKNALLAFFFGGLFGMVAQGIYFLFISGNVNKENATMYSSAIIILLAFLLTCFGIFDKFALIAHSGAFIPISGFSNAITSCALEGKAEGMVFGIGGKMFSLVGSVCTYGIISSIFLGFLYFLYKVII